MLKYNTKSSPRVEWLSQSDQSTQMASQERGLEISAAWSLCFKEAYYSFSETIYDSLPHVSICRACKIDASNLTK